MRPGNINGQVWIWGEVDVEVQVQVQVEVEVGEGDEDPAKRAGARPLCRLGRTMLMAALAGLIKPSACLTGRLACSLHLARLLLFRRRHSVNCPDQPD